MLVLQDGPTRADDHGAVTLDEACKSRLGGVCRAALKLFEQLPVRKAADRADLKKHLNLPEGSPCSLRTIIGSPATKCLTRHLVMPRGHRFIPIILRIFADAGYQLPAGEPRSRRQCQVGGLVPRRSSIDGSTAETFGRSGRAGSGTTRADSNKHVLSPERKARSTELGAATLRGPETRAERSLRCFMRSDMAKVIVERPRFGSSSRGKSKGYRRSLQRMGQEGLPASKG